MSSKDDPDTFIINSEESITECGKWVRRKFALYKYWTVTMRAGRKRKAIQNAKLWPTLTDISEQVVWHGKTYDEESWKDILSGSFKKHDFVPNTEGTGMVVLGMSTSNMSSTTFYAFMEFVLAFGETQGVKWSEKSKKNQEDLAAEKVKDEDNGE